MLKCSFDGHLPLVHFPIVQWWPHEDQLWPSLCLNQILWVMWGGWVTHRHQLLQSWLPNLQNFAWLVGKFWIILINKSWCNKSFYIIVNLITYYYGYNALYLKSCQNILIPTLPSRNFIKILMFCNWVSLIKHVWSKEN